jgi:uncharacterized membrane protein YbhN (UPF0104 family)
VSEIPGSGRPAGRRRWLTLLALLALLAGVGLLMVLVERIGVEAVWGTLSRAQPVWVLGSLASGFAGLAASGMPWRVLLPPALRPGRGAAVASRTAAAGMNAVLPLLSVGDVSRLLWLERAAWPQGLAAMAVERLLFALASAAAIAAGALAAATSSELPARLVPVAIAVALVICAMALFGLWLLARGKPVGALLRAGRRLRAAVARLPAGGDQASEEIPSMAFDQALQVILRGPRALLALAFVQHLCARALFVLETYAALRAVGVPVDLANTLTIAAVPIALSVAAVAIPSQIGIQEGTQAAVTAALGLGAEVGLSMTLLLRARQLLLLPITALCLALRRRRS